MACRGKSSVQNGSSLETELPAKLRILYIASIAEKVNTFETIPVMKTDWYLYSNSTGYTDLGAVFNKCKH